MITFYNYSPIVLQLGPASIYLRFYCYKDDTRRINNSGIGTYYNEYSYLIL